MRVGEAMQITGKTALLKMINIICTCMVLQGMRLAQDLLYI